MHLHLGFADEVVEDKRRPDVLGLAIALNGQRGSGGHLPPGRAGLEAMDGFGEELVDRAAMSRGHVHVSAAAHRPEPPEARVVVAPVVFVRRAGEDALPRILARVAAVGGAVFIDRGADDGLDAVPVGALRTDSSSGISVNHEPGNDCWKSFRVDAILCGHIPRAAERAERDCFSRPLEPLEYGHVSSRQPGR